MQMKMWNCAHSNEDENRRVHNKGIELTFKQKEEQK